MKPTLYTALIVTTVLNLVVVGVNTYLYLNPRPVQISRTVEDAPSLYEIRAYCQKLSAEAMGKTYKNSKGETVVFGYQSCVDQLIDAVKSENRTTLL